MWRSRLIAARRFRSANTTSVRRITQSNSKVHNPQTLASNCRTDNSFRSIGSFPQSYAISLFSSTSTDSIINDNNNNINNNNNDSDMIADECESNNNSFNMGEIWSESVDEAKSVFDSDSETHEVKSVFDSDSETHKVKSVVETEANQESVEPNNGETNEVNIDVDELERVIALLKSKGDAVDADVDVDVEVVSRSLESSLDEMNLDISEEFVMKVLEASDVSGENLIGFFKWAAVPVTTRLLDALVRAVSKELKKKVAYKLWDLVKEIGEKDSSVVSSEMLNVLISLFSRLGKGMAGFQVFSKFGELGCETNADSFYYTVQALCRRSIYDRVGLVCERMVSEGKLPEAGKVGDIMYYLCKGGMVKEAHYVYLAAKEKQIHPPQPPVNFLITSLCDRRKNDADSVHFALKMLDDIPNQKYAIKQFACVIQGLCRVNDIEGAKALLSRMIDNGPPPGNAIFNTVINALSKSGDLTEAIKVMRMMEDRGLKPDVFAYSVIMSGYVKGGEMEEAAKMLTEAKKNHCKLTPVIYHTIIRGYCKLEQFEKAVKLLEEMEEYGVRPTTDEYNKLIQSLCLKAADWVMAEKLMEEMTRKGLHLNGITKSLIRAVKELEEEGKGAKEPSVAA